MSVAAENIKPCGRPSQCHQTTRRKKRLKIEYIRMVRVGRVRLEEIPQRLHELAADGLDNRIQIVCAKEAGTVENT